MRWPAKVEPIASSAAGSGAAASGGGGSGHQPRAEVGVDVGPAGGGRVHRVDQLRLRGLLQHEAGRPAEERCARILGIVVLRHDDDGRPGRALDQLGDGGQARTAGHVEVEQDDRRPVCARGPQATVDVARLAHDAEVLLLLEQEPQAAAHHRVIVDDQDPDRCRGTGVAPQSLESSLPCASKPCGFPAFSGGGAGVASRSHRIRAHTTNRADPIPAPDAGAGQEATSCSLSRRFTRPLSLACATAALAVAPGYRGGDAGGRPAAVHAG